MSAREPSAATEQSPSSAGVCQVCGDPVEKRYGGEGRYPVVCADCWIDSTHDAQTAGMVPLG